MILPEGIAYIMITFRPYSLLGRWLARGWTIGFRFRADTQVFKRFRQALATSDCYPHYGCPSFLLHVCVQCRDSHWTIFMECLLPFVAACWFWSKWVGFMCCIVTNISFVNAYTFHWHLLCMLFEERNWVFDQDWRRGFSLMIVL